MTILYWLVLLLGVVSNPSVITATVQLLLFLFYSYCAMNSLTVKNILFVICAMNSCPLTRCKEHFIFAFVIVCVFVYEVVTFTLLSTSSYPFSEDL